MEEDRVFGTDQLNNGNPSSEEAGYKLEDILAEFGSQSEAAAVEAGPEPDAGPESGTGPEPGAEPESEAKPESGDTAEAETATDQAQPEEDELVRIWSPRPRRERKKREAQTDPEPRELPEQEAPPITPVPRKQEGVFRRLARRRANLEESFDALPQFTDEEARSDYQRRRNMRRLPQLLSWILTLLAALVVLLPLQTWIDLSAWLTPEIGSVVCIGVLLCQILLSLPVLTVGVQKLLTLRFSKESYIALTVLVTLLYGLRELLTGSDGAALCAVASLLLTVSQRGSDLLTASKAICLTRALSAEHPIAVLRGEAQWEGKACLSRRPDVSGELLPQLETQPAEKRLSVFCLLLTALTLAAALFAATRGGRDFLWSWSILLLGSCPLGAFWAYGRSFRALNRRLSSTGAIVLGWVGACRMSGSLGVIIKDDDLFSKNAVSLNGVKVFGAHSPDRLLGYAAAMLDRAGAGSASAFSESLELRGGKRFHTDHFRAYDIGGLGAEIQGDVVLLGSRAFLKTMGVEIPQETRVSRALYISLNGEAAGLFALRYSAAESTRSGLAAILGSRGLRPILATRDALLSPEMIGKIYKLPSDRLEFPVLRDRLALSEPERDGEFSRCALLARDSFLSFSAAITCGRRLCRCLRHSLLIACIGSVVGLLMMVLLALLGAIDSASAANLIFYHLVWLVPSLWLTSLFGS